MARTEITPIRATLRNTPCAAVTTSALFTAIDATNGNKIKWRDADENYIIALQNSDSSAAKTVTFETGLYLSRIDQSVYATAETMPR